MVFRKLIILALLAYFMPATAMKNAADGAPEGEPSAKRPRVWDTILEGTPLHAAYQRRDLFGFYMAAKSGAKKDEINPRDNHPIIITTQWGDRFTQEEREAAYDILVSEGANIRDARTSGSGMGLGHFFAFSGNVKMLKKSLISGNNPEQRIDPNQKDYDGCSSMHYAKDVKVAEIFYHAGAQVEDRDDRLRTPLYGVATDDPHEMKVAGFLVKINPHLVGLRDANGETAYERADRVRVFGDPNPALKNAKTVRPMIVGGDNGLFAPKHMGHPVFFDRARQTGAKNFNIRQIKLTE